ncbi:dephospho-CoA kinase [Halobacteriovorax sp. HLS]|uniref:dephospho-CoA kinase n=1 Tax=Halobacteriovorax sp. HLS TaxID=2234000 RepID=UPI000FDB6117|nr:dephospho-CoA kinase [Halobacteriovorax sp. HLS]
MKLKEIFITLTGEQRLYQVPCPVIGLTGGIATGKSSVTKKLEQLGVNVICADKLVKEVYSYPETIDFVAENFPQTVSKEGSIDFKSLRQKAFENVTNKETLENYIYQKLPQQFMKAFSALKEPTLLVYDVPLLFEKKMSKLFDLTICVYAPKETQIERIMKRDSCSKELAESILLNQIPIDEKKSLTDFTIDNSKGLSHLELEVEALLTILLD